jgi:predicted AlkP superfamily phosphohydrolase/phosphomutase
MCNNRKLLIIGIDGGTWSVLEPLCNANVMPTLKRLVSNGIAGDLKSTIPPVTGASWLSLATGKNPGKTGVIDFLIKEGNALRPINSNDFRKNRPFWECINSKKIIINYPMVYPPYNINGILISGLGSAVADEFTFPKNVKQEILEIAPNYRIDLDYMRYKDFNKYLKDIKEFLANKLKVDLYLLEKYEWSLAISIFSLTDWIQHSMWMYIDKKHPLYPGKNEYEEKLLSFWTEFDLALTKIIKKVGKDTNILIVSDHGFGPQLGCFNLAKWLERQGYLCKKRNFSSGFHAIFHKYEIFLRNIYSVFEKLIPQSMFKNIRDEIIGSTLNQINFEKSKAYSIGHTIPFGAIYIKRNTKNFENLKHELISGLKRINKDIREDLKVKFFDPYKIYNGDKIDTLPDILFTINDWSCIIEENLNKNYLFKNEPFSLTHTGSHRLNGIFVGYGPDFRSGKKITSATIFDIAPTVLHLLDVSIPTDMDGRVLKEIFRADSDPAKRSIVYQKSNENEKKRIKDKIRYLKKTKKI